MISIILYTSGKDREIFSTLQSIRDLQFKDYELVIVCNGCTSDVLNDMKIVEAKTIAFKTFKSPGLAKNEAVARAKNELLLFVDSGIKLQEGIIEEIIKTKNNWVVGTCKIKTQEDKQDYAKMYEFINKFLIPYGFDIGLVFCKKTTFEVLGKYDLNLLNNLNKEIIKRFKKMGKFLIIDTPIVYPTRDFENKKGMALYAISLKKFFSGRKQEDILEEGIIQKEEEL